MECFRGGGCTSAVRALADDVVLRDGALLADSSDRADHGYLPYFGYHPSQRAAMQQLALLALGHYRLVVDARQRWNELARVRLQTAKPYDVAGAILVGREVGAVVTRTDSGTLDFPLNVTTPVEFVAFHTTAGRVLDCGRTSRPPSRRGAAPRRSTLGPEVRSER